MAKRRPRSPDQILAEAAERRRQSFAAVGLSPEMADLVTHSDIDITRKAEKREGGKTVEDNSARRMDAFGALKDGMQVGCYDAARRLERDILTRRGEGDKGQRLARVDCEGGRDLADLIVAAGEACDAIQARLSPRDWWLLNDLIAPAVERSGGWRGRVAYITGETNWNAQGAAVRSACVNLRDAYEAWEREGAKKAA